MLNRIQTKLSGDGIGARVMRGSMVTFMGFGTSQLLRLMSNLILTRLLFPEAFGLMAIVTLFMTGLQMVSDVGLAACIVRSKRGDEPIFLNTAWVVQITRHIFLGLVCCVAAAPMARFYNESVLEGLMYGLAMAVFLMGLRSTKIATANRKIYLTRITIMDLGAQSAMIVTMVALATVWESAWPLIIGVIVENLTKVIISHSYLPGHSNRLQFERAAFWEQFHFGKYLFVSSGLTFVVQNGDRVLLSKFLSLAYLGFFNIAFFFASVPTTLMGRFMNRVILPLYSARPPAEAAANRRAISKTRYALTGGALSLLFVLALTGQWLVELLYTEEYHASGPILVILAISLMPSLIIQTYPFLLLATGKSNLYMYFQVCWAVLQISFLAVGLSYFGLIGAMAAQPLAALVIYPLLVWLVWPYKGHDLLHDAFFVLLVLVCVPFVLWVNDDALAYVRDIPVEWTGAGTAQPPVATPDGG